MHIRHQLMTITLKTPFLYHQAITDIAPETEALVKEAHTHFENHNIPKAMDYYKKALEHNPRSSYLISNFGTVLIVHGAASEGINRLRTAIKYNSACTGAYYNLGTVLLMRGELEGALENLKKACEIEPKNGMVKNNLGLTYLHLNRPDKARELFESTVQDNTQFVDCAAHNLGCMAYDQNDLPQAITWFERAQKTNPNNFAAFNNAACALFLQNETARAVDMLYMCINLNPHFQPSYYNLGFITYNQKHGPEKNTAPHQCDDACCRRPDIN